MIKRLSVVVSLAVLGIGVWLVSRGHEVDRVCKVNSVTTNGNQHFSHCMNLISTYFLGYALCILGFILLLMSIFVIRLHFRHVKLPPPQAVTAEQQPDDSNPFRAVMKQSQQSSEAPKDASGETGS
ncbi:MAG: hypothetical protein WAN30_07250 [Acidimicrobiales bacterium]